MSSGGRLPAFADAAEFAGVLARGALVADKYVVEHVLGSGGMGVVVAARHVQLGQLVAIKFMRVEAAKDENAINRFLREARAAAALSSEHVTRVLDVGTLESGAPYMVMECLVGTDLGELLTTSGPLPIADAAGAVLQACEAIAEAHELGIIHRDLKPSNLFVTRRRDGSPLVKVLDFGISKKIELNTQGARESLTVSGLVIGSPLYMSPEQLRSAKAADARSDIWSLGVILYELLTAEAPFGGDTLGEVLARILAEPPPLIRNRRPDIPEGLARLIMQCLERDVARRVQTVGELAVRLAPFAPAEAALAIDRLSRVSALAPKAQPRASSGPPGRSRTSPPSDEAGAPRRGHYQAEGTAARSVVAMAIESAPAGLRSSSPPVDRRRTARGTRVAAIVALNVVLLAAVVAFYEFRGRLTMPDHGDPRGRPAAASAAVVLPPLAPSTAPGEISQRAPEMATVIPAPVAAPPPPPPANVVDAAPGPSANRGVAGPARPSPKRPVSEDDLLKGRN